MANEQKIRRPEITVAWICALSTQKLAALAMLDENYGPCEVPQSLYGNITYSFGRIGQHNVVVACPPTSVAGTVFFADVASQLLQDFPTIRFGLMVGIGGGAPDAGNDVRLGDIVVSHSDGVIQYDAGKLMKDGELSVSERLKQPPDVISHALTQLRNTHALREGIDMERYSSAAKAKYPEMAEWWSYPGTKHDQLFQPQYDHASKDSESCEGCDKDQLVARDARAHHRPVIHYGLIASGSQLVRRGLIRDMVGKRLGVICFEMEAAGLLPTFPCLLIRGICDYTDTHKDKRWVRYAAAAAATYAKELLDTLFVQASTLPKDVIADIKSPGDPPDRLASQHELAMTYRANGQIEKAIELLEYVVAERERTLAEDHPDRLALHHELARAYVVNGRISEAVKLLEYVVTLQEQTLAEDHPNRLASQHELAVVYKERGYFDKAIELLKHVVKIKSKKFQETHPELLASQHELAVVYYGSGQFDKAVGLLEQVVKIQGKVLAEDHPDRLESWHALVTAQLADRQVQPAELLPSHPKLPFALSSSASPSEIDNDHINHSKLEDRTANDSIVASRNDATISETRIEPLASILGESRVYTDSGYASGPARTSAKQAPQTVTDFDDSRTDYSDASSISSVTREGYVSDLTNMLISGVCAETYEPEAFRRLRHTLPELLKAFALQLGVEASSRQHREIMVFLYRNRQNIVDSFEQKSSQQTSEENETKPSIASLDLHDFSVDNKIEEWVYDPENQDSLEDEAQGMVSLDLALYDEGLFHDLPDPSVYQELVSNSTAFQWLLATMRRELELDFTVSSYFEDVELVVRSMLPPQRKISRKVQLDPYKVIFWVEWNPFDYFSQQEYRESSTEALRSAITITGKYTDAEALTCSQYLQRTWPVTGEHILHVMNDLVTSGTRSTKEWKFDGGVELKATMNDAHLVVEASGSSCFLSELGGQLGWLGSALRPSPFPTGIVACTPHATPVDLDKTAKKSNAQTEKTFSCRIDFRVGQLTETSTATVGRCWQDLFRNRLVVDGYPVRRRRESNLGLEMPLNMMAELVSTRRLTLFKEKFYLKGFSMMLVLANQVENLMLWHLLFDPDGNHISYLDPRVNSITSCAAHSNPFNVERARHIVGWCEDVRVFTGAPGANYKILPSALYRPRKGFAFEKVAITAGKFISGGTTIAVGICDRPIHNDFQSTYLRLLESIAQEHVILYDLDTRRAWLVDGVSALLHLVRASLHEDEVGLLKSRFLFSSKEFREAANAYTGREAAMEVLLNESNLALKVFADPPERWEETTKEGEHVTAVEKTKKSFEYLRDTVERLSNVLEQLFAHQKDTDSKDGVGFRVSKSQRRLLEGFDFRDIARNNHSIWPYFTMLKQSGKEWNVFSRAIHATTLFGRGFGELIQPKLVAASTSAMDTNTTCCNSWKWMPSNRDNLAVCVYHIQEIMERHGAPHAQTCRVVDNIYWHSPETIFKPCQCNEGHGKICDRIQVLVPARNLGRATLKHPGVLKSGAVIFGHSQTQSLFKKDSSNSSLEVPQACLGKPDEQFTDSALGSSLDQSQIASDAATCSATGQASINNASNGQQSQESRPPSQLVQQQLQKCNDEDAISKADEQRFKDHGVVIESSQDHNPRGLSREPAKRLPLTPQSVVYQGPGVVKKRSQLRAFFSRPSWLKRRGKGRAES